MLAIRNDAICHDQLGLRSEHLAEAQPEVHRHADHQCNVGLAQRLRARPREGQLGGRRAPRRGPSRSSARGSAVARPERSSAAPPRPHHTSVPAMITGRCAADSSSKPGPGLRCLRGRRPARPAGRPGRRVGRHRPPWTREKTRGPSGSRRTPTPDGAPPSPAMLRRQADPRPRADCAVAAKRASGATNGTWSISCSDPIPQRSAGARPPSTSSGDWFCCAAAIALIPLVTPGPAVSAATPGAPGHLRPALGGESRGLLMPGVDQPDALLAAAVVDREQVAAGKGEHRVDSAGPQSPRDQLAGMHGLGGGSVETHIRSLSTSVGYLRQRGISDCGPVRAPHCKRRRRYWSPKPFKPSIDWSAAPLNPCGGSPKPG